MVRCRAGRTVVSRRAGCPDSEVEVEEERRVPQYEAGVGTGCLHRAELRCHRRARCCEREVQVGSVTIAGKEGSCRRDMGMIDLAVHPRRNKGLVEVVSVLLDRVRGKAVMANVMRRWDMGRVDQAEGQEVQEVRAGRMG